MANFKLTKAQARELDELVSAYESAKSALAEWLDSLAGEWEGELETRSENAPKLPWSADAAMRAMWAELDKGGSNATAQALFRCHLQAAFDAGRDSEMESLRLTHEQAIHDRDLAWRQLREKDVAMSVLFERLGNAGVDCSDLIPITETPPLR